jgi:hypothetical protein
MSVAALVLILNGTMVATASPPELVAGRAFVPYHAFVERIARSGTTDDAAGTIAITGAAHRIVLTIGSRIALVDDTPTTIAAAPFAGADDLYLPIAALAPVLDLRVRYDARTRELDIAARDTRELATPTPYALPAATVPPRRLFTPDPGPPTPRVQQREPPLSRRTPLPQYAPPR